MSIGEDVALFLLTLSNSFVFGGRTARETKLVVGMMKARGHFHEMFLLDCLSDAPFIYTLDTAFYLGDIVGEIHGHCHVHRRIYQFGF